MKTRRSKKVEEGSKRVTKKLPEPSSANRKSKRVNKPSVAPASVSRSSFVEESDSSREESKSPEAKKGRGQERFTLRKMAPKPKRISWAREDDIDIINRPKKKVAPTGRHVEEELNLQEWSRPTQIEFRDAEKATIRDFLLKGIRNNGWSESLYVTGLPGQGKTACLIEVVNALKAIHPEVGFYYLNGLKLSNPNLIFSKFWKQLTGLHLPHAKARVRLEDAFKLAKYHCLSPAEKKRLTATKILIIDEIDFLFTKSNDVLYSIFEWPHAEFSRMSIVCVANTLDFPQMILAKIGSRMGQKHINFPPYKDDQIERILRDRLKNSHLFKDEAITFVAKKCAMFSSDVRKSLQYCRRAIQYHRTEGDRRGQIGIELINKTLEMDSKTPSYHFITKQSVQFRTLLVAVINETEGSSALNRLTLDVDKVYFRFVELLNQQKEEKSSYQEFTNIVNVCCQMQILKLNRRAKDRTTLASAQNLPDLKYILRDDKIFIDYGRHG